MLTVYGNGECVNFIGIGGMMVAGGLSMVLIGVGESCFRDEVIFMSIEEEILSLML